MPRSLHPTHATNVAVVDHDKHVDFTATCSCRWRSDTVRLPVPHAGRDRIAAYRQALAALRRHEAQHGIS